MNQFPSAKDPDETRVLTIDLSENNRLMAGETVASAVFVVEEESGAAVVASDFLVGVADFSTFPLVKQSIKGGVDGKAYLIRVKGTTNTGRPFCTGGLLAIRKGA